MEQPCDCDTSQCDRPESVQAHLAPNVAQSEVDFFSRLATLSQLRHLDLELGYHTNVVQGRLRSPPTPSELTTLTHMSMRAPTLPQNAITFLCDVLMKAYQLETLHLNTTELSNAAACRFAASFEHIAGLRSISINGWDVMAASGSRAVAGAIQGLKQLTTLDLAGAFSEEMGYKHLTHTALPGLCNLKQLVLEGCELRDASVCDISNALSTLTGIEDLKVRRCLDPDERVVVGEKLTPVLQNMTNLRSLDLSCNGTAIDDIDCSALGKAFHCMKNLRILMMHDNEIGSDGAVALSNALVTTTQLHEINLDRNPLGDEGAESVAALIKKLPSLRRVEMLDTGMSFIGAQALMSALPDSDPTRCFSLYRMCRLVVTAALMRGDSF